MPADLGAQPLREVQCPACSRQSAYSPANRWRPFCSERCRMVDLGAWANERFRIADPIAPDAPGSAAPGATGPF